MSLSASRFWRTDFVGSVFQSSVITRGSHEKGVVATAGVCFLSPVLPAETQPSGPPWPQAGLLSRVVITGNLSSHIVNCFNLHPKSEDIFPIFFFSEAEAGGEK